jgi:peptide/nickel transport system permease protein
LAVLHPLLMATVWDPEIYDPALGNDPEILRSPSPSTLNVKTCWQEGLSACLRHPLGTSPGGQDILSQLMFSTRMAFILGILAAVVTVSLATTVGCLAAYFRGTIIDTLFMRLANFIQIFPTLSLLIVLTGLMKVTLPKLALIIGVIAGFGGITIILKSRALTVVVKPYIEAAKVAGGSHWHILWHHVIPNVLPLSFLYMMFTVTGAIFAEAVLSFFGLLPQVRMSWGIMISTANAYGGTLLGQYWYLWVPPGLSITLLCAAFYLVGRGLDEIVNPRLRQR